MLPTRKKKQNLILHVERIKDKDFFHEFEENPQDFPILAEMVKNGEIEFLTPLNIRLKAFRIRELYEVQGTFSASVRLACSRCLKDFATTLAGEFELTYTKEVPGLMDVLDEQEIELKFEEIGLLYFKGEEIHLHQGIQEQVVMAFPLQPLCHENCKGLCLQCGTDLNRGDCGCARGSGANPFAVLKNLKLNKK